MHLQVWPAPHHQQEFITMTAPALGIDIAKLKFNVCLININGKLRA